MADPRFFQVVGPFSLEQLAEISGAEIVLPKDISSSDSLGEFSDVAPLGMAGPTDVSFLDNRKYIKAYTESKAGAVLVAPDLVEKAPPGMTLLVLQDPYTGYAQVAHAFYPDDGAELGISKHAHISPDASIGTGVVIGPGVVIEERAEIGNNCRIGANTVIKASVVIHDDVSIGANATLTHCFIGNNAVIHSGVRIGQGGFGFAPGVTHTKIPQLGRVIIGADVDIGANTTIDRGAGPDTIIGDGTKIDNLVQIAHNVEIGRGCLIAAEVGISGSSKLGDYVMIGGQVGIAGHLNIGDGVKISAQSGVIRDIEAGQTIAGTPAVKASEFWRTTATIRKQTLK